jgi:hypothetical protein
MFYRIVLISISIVICSCIETNFIREKTFDEVLYFVNNTEQTLDVLVIGGLANNGYYYPKIRIAEPKSELRLFINSFDSIIISHPMAFQDALKGYRSKNDNSIYVIKEQNIESVKSSLEYNYKFTMDDLLAVAKPPLPSTHATCIFLQPDGSLQVLADYETPWAEQGWLGSSSCSSPKVGVAPTRRYDGTPSF